MADVATKCIAANDTHYGRAVFVDKLGNIQTVAPPDEKNILVDSLDARYDNRFDDPRYYTGDTAS